MSGILGGLFLVLICTIVLLQVGGNLIDRILIWIVGEPIGIIIPSYSDFAGFFLAASTFLALAHTLRCGEHIRVTLLVRKAPKRWRRFLELWCLGISGLLAAYFTYYTASLVKDSLEFGDLSIGIIPVPIWIPQAAMLLGLVVLAIALFDDFFIVASGRSPSYEAGDEKTPIEETL